MYFPKSMYPRGSCCAAPFEYRETCVNFYSNTLFFFLTFFFEIIIIIINIIATSATNN